MEKHFKIIKDRLCSDRVLVPFDTRRQCRVYCDASPFGTQATVAQRYEVEGEGGAEPKSKYSTIQNIEKVVIGDL